jgi:hypothetical protein
MVEMAASESRVQKVLPVICYKLIPRFGLAPGTSTDRVALRQPGGLRLLLPGVRAAAPRFVSPAPATRG